MRALIRLITTNLDHFDEKYMKIKFYSDYELPLNKKIKIPNIIIVRAVFHENNKYYPQVFLDKCLFKYKNDIL